MEMNHKDVVRSVFCEVLEQMAFMFGEAAEPDELDTPEELLVAAMCFTGPFSGSISLIVPREVCPLLAENMLGVEPDDERVMEKAQDALKELLNVVCGNVLTTLAGDEPVFDLTIPEVQDADVEVWNTCIEHPGCVPLLMDDYPAAILLSINEE